MRAMARSRWRRRAGNTEAPFLSALEFTAQLAAPDAVFDKPGLMIVASLTNVPREPAQP